MGRAEAAAERAPGRQSLRHTHALTHPVHKGPVCKCWQLQPADTHIAARLEALQWLAQQAGRVQTTEWLSYSGLGLA